MSQSLRIKAGTTDEAFQEQRSPSNLTLKVHMRGSLK